MAKNTTNMARTRKQKRDANKRYQELNREVKRRCRRDRRVYVESKAERAEEAGKRGDSRTLLSGRFQNACRPVRWRKHFQTVLNHEEPLSPPEGEPNDELNIRAGRITRIEIEDAIKKNTGRLQDATIYHLRQLRREGTRQRRCF